ncbi:MAG TPA: hypothetical protein VD793_03860 [Gemmatimonadales bacterium]|nr:hypothetical protein [Gemmatimonadales bacterium]
MAARDPVVLALASIAAGAGAGGAVITAGLVALRALQDRRGVHPQDDLTFLLLSAAVLLGVVAAVTVAWKLTVPIEDYWRRGVTAAVAVTVGFGLAGGAVPVDLVTGAAGLAFYAALLAGLAAWAGRRARLAS